MRRRFLQRIGDGLNAFAFITVLAGVITAGWALLGMLVGVAIKVANFVLGV